MGYSAPYDLAKKHYEPSSQGGGRFSQAGPRTISFKQYYLPSRQYMNGTIVPIIYKGCKTSVIEKIDKVPYIALTTDAWKSFAKQSYAGLTCHLIDHNGELQNFLL